mmetsp:Transcript_64413/g.153655  ORF Transcript_64413/g.153655 Transcript_64413/m.153655 type:complete len:240 (-) Transcript_64413:1123-1842(-)
MCMGFHPFSPAMLHELAFFNRCFTASVRPFIAAKCRGESPVLSRACTSARACTNFWITSMLPPFAAKWRGVHSKSSVASTEALSFSRLCTAYKWPNQAAACNNFVPSRQSSPAVRIRTFTANGSQPSFWSFWRCVSAKGAPRPRYCSVPRTSFICRCISKSGRAKRPPIRESNWLKSTSAIKPSSSSIQPRTVSAGRLFTIGSPMRCQMARRSSSLLAWAWKAEILPSFLPMCATYSMA